MSIPFTPVQVPAAPAGPKMWGVRQLEAVLRREFQGGQPPRPVFALLMDPGNPALTTVGPFRVEDLLLLFLRLPDDRAAVIEAGEPVNGPVVLGVEAFGPAGVAGDLSPVVAMALTLAGRPGPDQALWLTAMREADYEAGQRQRAEATLPLETLLAGELLAALATLAPGAHVHLLFGYGTPTPHVTCEGPAEKWVAHLRTVPATNVVYHNPAKATRGVGYALKLADRPADGSGRLYLDEYFAARENSHRGGRDPRQTLWLLARPSVLPE